MGAAANAAERQESAVEFAELMAWAAKAAQAPLPEGARRRAAIILADDIGAMLAGAVEPEVTKTRNGFVSTSRGVGEASVFAPGAPRLDRYAAAAANGMAVTWCELDEGFRSAPCHAGAYALPALLAEAEATGVSGERVLAVLAVSYEIAARAALAFPFDVMTVHPHAAFATIGAAAGAALVRGLDKHGLAAAVSGAASMAFAGPFGHAVDGALVRNAWTSAGAWIGLRSADWAQAGIGGVPESLYDVFVSVFGTRFTAGALTEELGVRWAVEGGYHKIFACCQYAHSAVEASLALHGRMLGASRNAADIDEITVETHPRGLNLTAVEPPTVLSAKFSMPHAAAASAVTGTGGQVAFSSGTLSEPQIARLRRCVRLVPHPDIRPWPLDRPARVTWRFKDGETWTESCENARGGADQPFGEDVLFDKLSGSSIGFPHMTSILKGFVEGDEPLLKRPWRDTVSSILQGE